MLVGHFKILTENNTLMKIFTLIIGLTCLAALGSKAQTSPAYQKELDAWVAERVTDLKAADGWLNLVGLYWLSEGKNTFGSGADNKIVFPKGSISNKTGYFKRSGNTVTMVVEDGTEIKVGGQLVKSEAVIYATEIPAAPLVSTGNLRWSVIKREDKIGVRVRDISSPLAASFTGTERFAADEKWVIPAKLQVAATPASISITNVIGQTTSQKSPGKLVFTIDGKQYALDAMEEGDELFIVFGDATSGVTTYPSGRFVYAKKPGADGNTLIDFNRAYNPPCAFTDYATCPLPPKQNILPVAVTAGEKNYGDHHQ